MKTGNLNFLEPSGPAKACDGNALILPFTFVYIVVYLFIARTFRRVHVYV